MSRPSIKYLFLILSSVFSTLTFARDIILDPTICVHGYQTNPNYIAANEHNFPCEAGTYTVSDYTALRGQGDCSYFGKLADNSRFYACQHSDATKLADRWLTTDTDQDGIVNGSDPEPFARPTDPDNDGIHRDVDNCQDHPNPSQWDTDNDGLGDACDTDIDGDGHLNYLDNCPFYAGASLVNDNYNATGDICDTYANPSTDHDSDGIPDQIDNCPQFANSDQEDSDLDGVGDACPHIPSHPTTALLQVRMYKTSYLGGGVVDYRNMPCTNMNIWAAAPYRVNLSVPEIVRQRLQGKGDCRLVREDGSNSTTIVSIGQTSVPDSVLDTDMDGIPNSDDGLPFKPLVDEDGDLVDDELDDNCLGLYNPEQIDIDEDGIGDACDPFIDNDSDGIENASDNCPDHSNPDQSDEDGDGLGDPCDPQTPSGSDQDGDSYVDAWDNCPTLSNPSQWDFDNDGLGDACDTDKDNDSIVDYLDNCPWYSSSDLSNNNLNATGDVCDSAANPSDDHDSDGIPDQIDNCPQIANPEQEDSDLDGIGDICPSIKSYAGENVQLQLRVEQGRYSGININFREMPCSTQYISPVAAPTRSNRSVPYVVIARLQGKGQCQYLWYSGSNGSSLLWISNPATAVTSSSLDTDQDGVPNDSDARPYHRMVDEDGDGLDDVYDDNCPSTYNPDQTDIDLDGIGDVCDSLIDRDLDGIGDSTDNCVNDANPDQVDVDADGIGDVCDPLIDNDGDGVGNDVDNCPSDSNSDQSDRDGDGLGNICDPDEDGDGILNETDNCRFIPNPDQTDSDGDGMGEPCDTDTDNDGVSNFSDNCPNDPNPDQIDVDADRIGDVCDPLIDSDFDLIGDEVDNCPTIQNADQADMDGDVIGDVCDSDVDGDGHDNSSDNCPTDPNPGQEDFNNDGIGDECQPDTTAPILSFLDNGRTILEGAEISSPGAMILRLTDDLDPEPQILNVDFSRNGQPISGLVWSEDDNDDDYILASGVISTSQDPITATVDVTDYRGNTATYTLTFMYAEAPTRVAGVSSINIPLVNHNFTSADGNAPINFEVRDVMYRAIEGVHTMSATIPSDAPFAIYVGDVLVTPGNVVQVVSPKDYEVDPSVNLTVRPADLSNSGSVELTLLHSSPRAPQFVTTINTWSPELTLETETPEISAVINGFEATLRVSNGACLITGDQDSAQESNVFNNPTCHVQLTNAPPGQFGLTTSYGGVNIEGFGTTAGVHSYDYVVRLYDPGTATFYNLADGSGTVTVNSALDYTDFQLTSDLTEFSMGVDEITVSLTNEGERCQLFFDEAAALEYSAVRTFNRPPACHFGFTTLPDGLEHNTSRSNPYAQGYATTPGSHSISWQVLTYAPNGDPIMLESKSVDVSIVDVAAPIIDFTPYNENFAVSVDGGYLGLVTSSGYNAYTTLEVFKNDELISTREYSPAFNRPSLTTSRRIYAEPANMYEDVNYRFRISYTNSPSKYSEMEVQAVSVPTRYIGPIIEVESDETLNVPSFPVRVKIGDSYKPDEPYSSEQMGNWQVRLVEAINYKTRDPLTDWQDVNGQGFTDFVLDLSSEKTRTLRLTSEARLVIPDQPFEYTKVARRGRYVKVFDGTELPSYITTYRNSGAAPYMAQFSLYLDDRKRNAEIGNIDWMIRGQGEDWSVGESMRKTSKTRFVTAFDVGHYEIFARVYNKYSDTYFDTNPLSITAYHQPEIAISAPTYAFIGDTVPIAASITRDGNPVPDSDLVIEWTTDGGVSWQEGSSTFNITSEVDQRINVEVRARFRDAPTVAQDLAATTSKRHSTVFKPIKQPSVNITGPFKVEVGKTYELTARVRNPYPNMQNNLSGYFTLPDDSIVHGTTLSFTPTLDDLNAENGVLVITYTGEIDGFESSGGTKTYEFKTRPWLYEWPSWQMTSRLSYAYAPTALTLKIIQGSRLALDNPQYSWSIPSSSGLTDNEYPRDDIKSFHVTEPGTYVFSATITDDRGNSSVVSETIEVLPQPPIEISPRVYYDNSYNRAPLTTTIYSYISGGHPADPVDTWSYQVDGTPIPDQSSYKFRTTLGEGNHSVVITATTKAGVVQDHEIPISVTANQVPSCSGSMVEYTSSWSFVSTCTDPDGKVVRRHWEVDGTPLDMYTAKVTLPKSSYPSLPDAQVIAEDDSGGLSNPYNF